MFQHSPRERRGVPHKPGSSSLRCYVSVRPVLAHGALRIPYPPARARERLRFTFPPPSPAGWAVGAIRLAAVATLCNTSTPRLSALDSPSRTTRETRVRPSLLDLCHGAGHSSPVGARASELPAYSSTHRAKGAACHSNQEGAPMHAPRACAQQPGGAATRKQRDTVAAPPRIALPAEPSIRPHKC